MNEKLININNKTDFAHIMNYANCETKLHRTGKELIYFKVKINNIWNTLCIGDKIKIDLNYNIILI